MKQKERPGVIAVRVFACLLLAASLAGLFLPWLSLRCTMGVEKLSLREADARSRSMGGDSLFQSYLERLPEAERSFYAGLLEVLDPLTEDRISPLGAALACTRAYGYLGDRATLGNPNEELTRAAGVAAGKTKQTALFLWALVALLGLTGIYAAYSAAAGYGFGTMPYLFTGVLAAAGAILARSMLNDWSHLSTRPAVLLNSILTHADPYHLSTREPFGLTLWFYLFIGLLILGVLLALCVLKPQESAAPAPAPVYRPAPITVQPVRSVPKAEEQVLRYGRGFSHDAPPPGEGFWRCPCCGAAVEELNLYCVHCGTRRPEPRRCAACGELLNEKAAFCPACGLPAGTRTAPPAVQSADPDPSVPEDGEA